MVVEAWWIKEEKEEGRGEIFYPGGGGQGNHYPHFGGNLSTFLKF